MPRIAFIGDIHHGKNNMTKKASQALELLGEFAAFVEAEQPDLVIELGDRISDQDHDADLVLEREVADAFRAINVPVRHLCGNHDRDFLSIADNEAILGQPMGHEVVDLGNWQVLIWRADTYVHRRPTGLSFRLAEGDLAWLNGEIQRAAKPSIVATHIPLSGQSQRSNYYFHNNYEVSVYPEIEDIQSVLRQASVPMVCVSGHVHWNSLTIVDAIPHITLQSLTESFTNPPHASRAWGLLELGDAIEWTAFGRQRFQVALDIPSTKVRWVAPHARF